MRLMKRSVTPLLFSTLAFAGCANTLGTSGDGLSSGMGKTVIGEDGEPIAAGDGDLGGYNLISARTDIDCLAYPVSPRALVTPASCVEECGRDELGITAVMRGEGQESQLMGLVDWVSLAPMGQFEGQESLAVIHLDRDQAEITGHSVSEHADGALSYLGEPRALEGLDTLTGRLVSDGTCPSRSLGLFNEARELVGISLGMSGRCDEFLFLDAFRGFIEEATTAGYQPPVLEPQPEPEPEPEPEPGVNYEQAERDALARAPASCDVVGETYCDGDVEVRCDGEVYTALSCAQVGWRCVVSEMWGASCEP